MYADVNTVKKDTNEVREGIGDIYDAILSLALAYDDKTINGELKENNIPLPTIPSTVEITDPLNNLLAWLYFMYGLEGRTPLGVRIDQIGPSGGDTMTAWYIVKYK
jgi:hypothetical protein